MRASRTVIVGAGVFVILAGAAGAGGCRRGIGGECDSSTDCMEGLICDPQTRTCQPGPGTSTDAAPGTDASGATDAAGGGTDAAGTSDAAGGGSDADSDGGGGGADSSTGMCLPVSSACAAPGIGTPACCAGLECCCGPLACDPSATGTCITSGTCPEG